MAQSLTNWRLMVDYHRWLRMVHGDLLLHRLGCKQVDQLLVTGERWLQTMTTTTVQQMRKIGNQLVDQLVHKLLLKDEKWWLTNSSWLCCCFGVVAGSEAYCNWRPSYGLASWENRLGYLVACWVRNGAWLGYRVTQRSMTSKNRLAVGPCNCLSWHVCTFAIQNNLQTKMQGFSRCHEPSTWKLSRITSDHLHWCWSSPIPTDAHQGLKEFYLPFNDVADVSQLKWLGNLQAQRCRSRWITGGHFMELTLLTTDWCIVAGHSTVR